MKHITTVALLLNIGVAGVYANEKPVTLTFSGNGQSGSAINLQQPNTTNGEENVVGTGTLGAFTFRNISADATSPQSSNTCSGPNKAFFPRVAGAGIFRFEDGSLLNVTLTQGGDCINFAANEGNCTLTFQINGGTGRFKDASGTLTYTETALPVLTDALGNPVYFTETGDITGAIYGVAEKEEHPGEQQ